MDIVVLGMHSKCIGSFDNSILEELKNNVEASRSAIDGDREGE